MLAARTDGSYQLWPRNLKEVEHLSEAEGTMHRDRRVLQGSQAQEKIKADACVSLLLFN